MFTVAYYKVNGELSKVHTKLRTLIYNTILTVCIIYGDIYINSNCVMETTSLILLYHTNMQDVKDDETDPAATQLSSSVKQVRSDPAAKQLPTSTKQLSLSPSGVGICYDDHLLSLPDVERTLSELNFKYIDLDKHIHHHQVDLKTCLSIIAQSKAYPTILSAAGSQPFVIAVFVTGVRGHSPGSLDTLRGSVDIVDDIIKPFLPKSAPHLAHIPKLFFISCCSHHKDLDTQPPSFPDDKDANYCIAYHLAQRIADTWKWIYTITDCLRSNMTVQDVIEDSRSDKHNERLYTFSCLKDKLVLFLYIFGIS